MQTRTKSARRTRAEQNPLASKESIKIALASIESLFNPAFRHAWTMALNTAEPKEASASQVLAAVLSYNGTHAVLMTGVETLKAHTTGKDISGAVKLKLEQWRGALGDLRSKTIEGIQRHLGPGNEVKFNLPIVPGNLLEEPKRSGEGPFNPPNKYG